MARGTAQISYRRARSAHRPGALFRRGLGGQAFGRRSDPGRAGHSRANSKGPQLRRRQFKKDHRSLVINVMKVDSYVPLSVLLSKSCNHPVTARRLGRARAPGPGGKIA